jgi:hypothetical protein
VPISGPCLYIGRRRSANKDSADPTAQMVQEMTARRNPPLAAEDIRAFETRFGAVLPDEYRQFLMREGNGGSLGPRYGLLRLGMVPAHWSEIHDYATRLRRPFPLEGAWVWEDEPDTPDLERRIDSTDDGVLLLGEEGCGARWVLVVSGRRAGEVWLTTGEGAAPTGLTFRPWLERFEKYGEEWWVSLVRTWGPSTNIWFASHAVKQLYALELKEKGSPPAALARGSPLCFDCIAFLGRACAWAKAGLAGGAPDLFWIFSGDGSVKALRRQPQP